MMCRCPWVDLSKHDYVEYHDKEWGVPVHDDRKIFEFLVLESAQAGLNWYTILRKRENFRIAFNNFDPKIIAKYDKNKIDQLLQNSGIIRNKAKISAAINNAQKFLEIKNKFETFDSYIWRFVNGNPIVSDINKLEDYRATSKESDTISKDLKQRGFKFLGSKICYAYMQAIGLVNDHSTNCFRKQEIINLYKK
jgi:DNA-3-methyladenine glycosylase I